MKQVKINLYKFNELKGDSRETALNYFRDTGEYEDMTEEDLIDTINVNYYWFFYDGVLAHCVTYMENNKPTGKEEFKFHKQIIQMGGN